MKKFFNRRQYIFVILDLSLQAKYDKRVIEDILQRSELGLSEAHKYQDFHNVHVSFFSSPSPEKAEQLNPGSAF